MSFAFIIVAGGKGVRAGGSRPKQFAYLGGKQLWRWSFETALETGADEIVLVFPEDDCEVVRAQIVDAGFDVKRIRVVHGGAERPDSVMAGLDVCAADFVMIHDAARPLLTRELCARLMGRVGFDCGVIPVIPVADALKRIDGDAIEAVDREKLYGTQTPQTFPREKLVAALKLAASRGLKPKDEAEAWLLAGNKLCYVDGERLNFKVTWQEDIMLANGYAEQLTGVTRTGLGYDVHPLTPSRELILAGVRIENAPLGLDGHSDADVVAHAVSDALLGAAGLPDIGNLFPASDMKYKNADSMKLLSDVVERVRAAGWNPSFVDGVISAQTPRLNSYITEMKRNLARVIGCEVNLKVKSGEHVPPVGDALCIVCRAVATVCRAPARGPETP